MGKIRVDLNSDIGESFSVYKLGLDEEIIKYITSANIACGWHAGDPIVMNKTVAMAKEYHVGIGAHPGFPDLMGFGRRQMKISPEEMKNYTIYQMGAMLGFANANDIPLQHIKAHGALSNIITTDFELAKAFCEGACAVMPDVIILVLPNSNMHKAAEAVGMCIACEVYADRAYMADYSLVPRSLPGAVIHDPKQSIKQVLEIVLEGKVTCLDGRVIEIPAQSICVHGDNPSAINITKELRDALENANVEIVSLNRLV